MPKLQRNRDFKETSPEISTKTHFNEKIMIDTKGQINPPSDGHQYIFVIVDAFSHFVTIRCAPKNNAYYDQTTGRNILTPNLHACVNILK